MKVLYIYLPVLHAQSLAFLEENRELPIWILDNVAGKTENVYLERDARALPAQVIYDELVKAHGFTDVSVIDQTELQKRAGDVSEFIIPEDEIVRFLLERYAPEVPVTAKNIFIRWTQKLSTTEFEVPPDRVITQDTFARDVMQKLTGEAEKSPDWWRQIATMICKDGKEIAVAHNAHFPSPHALAINGDPRSNLDAGQGPGIYTSIHAEASAIAKAAKSGVSVEGADAYVTTFPCPACARLMVEAGVARVYYQKGYSLLDAESILKDAGVEIVLVQ
jgi:dCMP deaminase